jgi:transcriptional regulator with XRE-family HTH domain
MKERKRAAEASPLEVARDVLKETLRRGPVSLDEIGRRMGHVRGYLSRALRGVNPLTLDTIIGALQVAGIEPSEYFANVAKALTPPEVEDKEASKARIEETVLRTLRRLGLEAPVKKKRVTRRG